jgi:hypothetical protein
MLSRVAPSSWPTATSPRTSAPRRCGSARSAARQTAPTRAGRSASTRASRIPRRLAASRCPKRMRPATCACAAAGSSSSSVGRRGAGATRRGWSTSARPRAPSAMTRPTLRHFIAPFHDPRLACAVRALCGLRSARRSAPPRRGQSPHAPRGGAPRCRRTSRACSTRCRGWRFGCWTCSLTEPLAGQERGVRLRARVEYMDARLEAPRLGVLQLDLVDSRVFASRLELVEQEPGPAVPGPDANAR